MEVIKMMDSLIIVLLATSALCLVLGALDGLLWAIQKAARVKGIKHGRQ